MALARMHREDRMKITPRMTQALWRGERWRRRRNTFLPYETIKKCLSLFAEKHISDILATFCVCRKINDVNLIEDKFILAVFAWLFLNQTKLKTKFISLIFSGEKIKDDF